MRGGPGKPWGNALGGYKKQRRVGGQFASGSGPSMPKVGSAKARRAEGFKKKKAADSKARRKKNTRNSVIGAVVIGAAAGGAAVAIHHQRSKSKGPDRIQLSPTFFKKIHRRKGPRPKTIPNRPKGKVRHRNTGPYKGREIKWVDPANKSLKFGTLRRGKISNGSPEIWTKGIKVSGAGGRRASTVIGVSSKSVQMGAIKSKSVSALTGTKAKKAPLRSRTASAKRAREQRAIDRMMR